jgi:hypothetical protein
MSWQNVNLYSRALPTYNTKKKATISGDDPKNKGVISKLIRESK